MQQMNEYTDGFTSAAAPPPEKSKSQTSRVAFNAAAVVKVACLVGIAHHIHALTQGGALGVLPIAPGVLGAIYMLATGAQSQLGPRKTPGPASVMEHTKNFFRHLGF